MKDGIKWDDLKFFKLAVPHNARQAKERLNHTRRFQTADYEVRREVTLAHESTECVIANGWSAPDTNKTPVRHSSPSGDVSDFLSEEKPWQNTDS